MSNDKNGYSVQLLSAIESGDMDWITVTLHFGADTTYIDDDGNTAMHKAVAMADPEIAELVLELILDKGGDPNLKNKEGKTPIDIADSLNRWDLALKMAGYKI